MQRYRGLLEDGLKSRLLADGADGGDAIKDARALSEKVLTNLGISRPTSNSGVMSTRSGTAVVQDSGLWRSVAKAKQDNAALTSTRDFQGE